MSILELLLPILEVAGVFKFICNDFGNFLNRNKKPDTYFVASLDVKAWNSEIWFFWQISGKKRVC